MAATAFATCFVAFLWQLLGYQANVREWSETDLSSRAELTARILAEPLQTLDFKAIQAVADSLKADGLRLRITEGRFFVSEDVSRTGFFDTSDGRSPAEGPCVFKVASAGNFSVGVGRPSAQMLRPYHEALLAVVLAALVGMAGVLLLFLVTYRQRVRIAELKRAERFRREFVADVSHEIKTPLAGIIGAVDLLEGESPLVPLIRKEAGRLNALVQSILDLSRLERDGARIEAVETDLGALVREEAERYGCRCRARENLSVKCDPELMARAVGNLVGNAKRHSGTDDIEVTVDVIGGRAKVKVEDHGVGIPPEHRGRIFERFYRVDAARSAETGGSGLGLAIVSRIARLHGGEVRLEPVIPHGARFVLTFPA